MSLDLKDKKLLYELELDSRQSASQLARKIGISKQGCTFKINHLIKKGVISSFPAVINTALLGYLSFRMYFKMNDLSPQKEKEFVDYLIKNEAVPWVVGGEGLWDYLLVVYPKDFQDFETFNVELNNQYGQYIERKDIALLTQVNHFRAGFLLGTKKDLPPLIYARQPKEIFSLEIIEKKILSLLAENSRLPLIEMSKILKIPAKNIAYRIEKLKSLGIIEGYTLTMDLDKVGFERYKLFIRVKNFSAASENRFLQYSQLHPHILYYSRSIGNNDIELELIVPNTAYLREMLTQIRSMFGEVIKSYDLLKIYKEFKMNYYPWR